MTPSAVHVGNIVQGARLAWAQGRDIGMLDEDSDTARKVRVTTECLKQGKNTRQNVKALNEQQGSHQLYNMSISPIQAWLCLLTHLLQF